MKLGGCQVVIKCDDTTMREFEPAVNEDGWEVSCWIASRPGKEFWIEYSRNLNYGPPDTELTADVYFDGVPNGGWIAPDPSPRAKKAIGGIYGSRQGKKLHHFVFSNPEIIEGETPSSVNLDCIGTILVVLGFADKSGCTRMEAERRIIRPGPTRVNEKDKKLGVHCAALKESSEECAYPVFFSTPTEDSLAFEFQCRAEEWLQAEGIMRKRRRQRGEQELVEDLGVSPLPKPEPVEEALPANEVLMGGAETLSTTRSPPRPRSPTPLSYADEELAAQRGELQRPRKIPRRSLRNFTIATNGETQSTVTGVHSIHQAPAEGGPGPKVKVEKDGLLSNVNAGEGDSMPKIKEEMGEVKLNELKAEEKELEEQMAELRKKSNNLRERMATFQTRSPRPKTKTERESTRPPLTPEVIDLTD